MEMTYAQEIEQAERALMQAMGVQYPTPEIMDIARDMVIARRHFISRLMRHSNN